MCYHFQSDFFKVAEDPLFKRNGYDVTIEVPLTISQALLGGSISIPTLDGKEIEMMVTY